MKILVSLLLTCAPLFGQTSSLDLLNHNRPTLDAHNCYPYNGQWSDRLDRALGTGFPVGIEQDLAWAIDKSTGKGRVVVSHAKETSGDEPALRDHFFEHVRPIVEKALRDNDRASWPLIIVHFDVKDNQPALLHATWDLLGEYESWITTAPVTADPHVLTPFDVKPLLVLTEDSDAQEAVFFRPLQPGAKLRLFGSAHTAPVGGATREERAHLAATVAPELLLTEKPTNYRRWWNNSWAEVEEGGQTVAGDWTPTDERRLRALVDHAHQLGYWIRFYTLDGFVQAEGLGWDKGYNFGSRDAALRRWQAAVEAGVNLIATDQYEDLSAYMKGHKTK
jgi:hypothetical protein